MVGFILAIIGLFYSAKEFTTGSLREKKYRREFDLSVQRRCDFVDKITASSELISALEQNVDYTDVVDDINYIFDKGYLPEEIGELIRLGKKEFGKERLYKDIVLELRLSMVGKSRGILQESGIRFCDESYYYKSLLKYYELLQKYFHDNGIDVEIIEKTYKGSAIKEMNFKEMTII